MHVLVTVVYIHAVAGVSWEEEDHVQKESIHLWTKGSPLISHTHTSSGLSGVWITEGRGGEESSPVREEEAGERAARMVRAGWGGGEGRGGPVPRVARKSTFIPHSATLWGGW